jgi:hypothetical protein
VNPRKPLRRSQTKPFGNERGWHPSAIDRHARQRTTPNLPPLTNPLFNDNIGRGKGYSSFDGHRITAKRAG